MIVAAVIADLIGRIEDVAEWASVPDPDGEAPSTGGELIRWRDYWPARAEGICVPGAGVHLGCPHAVDATPAPPDVVPREVRLELVVVEGERADVTPEDLRRFTIDPVTRNRVLLEVPAWAAGYAVGSCADCDRPMATAGARRRVPELRLYFARRSRDGRCRGCALRLAEGRPTVVELHATVVPGRERPRLSHAEVTRLRAQVACLGCGAVPAERLTRGGNVVVATRHRRGCVVALIREG